MADDVNQVFSGDKRIQNPDGSFLSNVIKPIYEILSKVIFVLLDSTCFFLSPETSHVNFIIIWWERKQEKTKAAKQAILDGATMMI